MFNGSFSLCIVILTFPLPLLCLQLVTQKCFTFIVEFSLEKSEFRHVNTSRFLSDILQSDLVKYITVYYVFVLEVGQKSPGTGFYLRGMCVCMRVCGVCVCNGNEHGGQEMNNTLIL